MIPGLGRSPRKGNGNPVQYSCLKNPLDRGAWWATVHVVAESDTTDQLAHTLTLLLLEKQGESQNFRDRIKLCKKPVQILHFVKEKSNTKVESDF